MSARSWLYTLVLTCALVMVASLAFLSRPALAQSPPGPLKASAGLSPMQQAIIADLGERSPLGQQILWRAHNSVPAPALKQPVPPVKNPSADCTGWSLVSTPNGAPDYNSLVSVSSVSPNDIWAVGQYCCTASGAGQNLIEHWNGSAWSIVPSPNVGDFDNLLSGVVALSTNNAWAVGFFFDGDRIETLTLHWDGSSWTVVPSPNPGPRNNYLDAVDAAGPNDIWAVGGYRAYVGGPFVTLAEHWDGRTWSVVSTPNPGPDRQLFGSVAVLSPSNVWAVGFACATADCGDPDHPGRTLVEHYDGYIWRVIDSPNFGTRSNQINAIDASRPNDVWAVGGYCVDVDCNSFNNDLLHWNGTAWSLVTTPDPATNGAYWGLLALAANNLWIGGSRANGDGTWSNLLFHWDGASWTNVSVASPGAFDNDLRAFTAGKGPNSVWVVGDYDNGEGERTQAQHYDGPCK